MQLLEITDGMLTRVTDSNKLIGSLVLPDSVTEIGREAFYCCTGLTSVRIPDSVHKIDKWSFFSCTALTSVVISKSVTEIGSMTFTGCINLTNLTVDSENPVYCSEGNIIYTKDRKKLIAAASCLKSVIIADGVTEISESAFFDCGSLTNVIIPNNVTTIGEHAFSYCSKLKTVIIDSAILTDIEDNAFENVHADVHFTVKTDAVKALLKKSSNIRDEQITVAQVCG